MILLPIFFICIVSMIPLLQERQKTGNSQAFKHRLAKESKGYFADSLHAKLELGREINLDTLRWHTMRNDWVSIDLTKFPVDVPFELLIRANLDCDSGYHPLRLAFGFSLNQTYLVTISINNFKNIMSSLR